MSERALLRHTLATVAYRGGKTIRDAPPEFANFAGAGRTPLQIVAHMGDLFEWALRMAKGDKSWRDTEVLDWERQTERFFATLAAFDECLESPEPLRAPVERLFQGPIADALSHVGQLAMLRRLTGFPMRGENYFVAEIVAGRVGSEQARAVREFE